MKLIVVLPADLGESKDDNRRENKVAIDVDPSTPMMDILVNIATQYRFNASKYRLNVEGHEFKASTPIGSLDVGQVLIVPKMNKIAACRRGCIGESSISGAGLTDMPASNGNSGSICNLNVPFQTTVRLQVNLPRNQLMVLRVSPTSTLEQVKTLICEKKDLNISDYNLVMSNSERNIKILDTSKTLSYYGVNEVTFISNRALSELKAKLEYNSSFTSFTRATSSSKNSTSSSSSSSSSFSGNPPKTNQNLEIKVDMQSSSSATYSNKITPSVKINKTHKKRPAPPPPISASSAVKETSSPLAAKPCLPTSSSFPGKTLTATSSSSTCSSSVNNENIKSLSSKENHNNSSLTGQGIELSVDVNSASCRNNSQTSYTNAVPDHNNCVRCDSGSESSGYHEASLSPESMDSSCTSSSFNVAKNSGDKASPPRIASNMVRIKKNINNLENLSSKSETSEPSERIIIKKRKAPAPPVPNSLSTTTASNNDSNTTTNTVKSRADVIPTSTSNSVKSLSSSCSVSEWENKHDILDSIECMSDVSVPLSLSPSFGCSSKSTSSSYSMTEHNLECGKGRSSSANSDCIPEDGSSSSSSFTLVTSGNDEVDVEEDRAHKSTPIIIKNDDHHGLPSLDSGTCCQTTPTLDEDKYDVSCNNLEHLSNNASPTFSTSPHNIHTSNPSDDDCLLNESEAMSLCKVKNSHQLDLDAITNGGEENFIRSIPAYSSNNSRKSSNKSESCAGSDSSKSAGNENDTDDDVQGRIKHDGHEKRSNFTLIREQKKNQECEAPIETTLKKSIMCAKLEKEPNIPCETSTFKCTPSTITTTTVPSLPSSKLFVAFNNGKTSNASTVSSSSSSSTLLSEQQIQQEKQQQWHHSLSIKNKDQINVTNDDDRRDNTSNYGEENDSKQVDFKLKKKNIIDVDLVISTKHQNEHNTADNCTHNNGEYNLKKMSYKSDQKHVSSSSSPSTKDFTTNANETSATIMSTHAGNNNRNNNHSSYTNQPDPSNVIIIRNEDIEGNRNNNISVKSSYLKVSTIEDDQFLSSSLSSTLSSSTKQTNAIQEKNKQVKENEVMEKDEDVKKNKEKEVYTSQENSSSNRFHHKVDDSILFSSKYPKDVLNDDERNVKVDQVKENSKFSLEMFSDNDAFKTGLTCQNNSACNRSSSSCSDVEKPFMATQVNNVDHNIDHSIDENTVKSTRDICPPRKPLTNFRIGSYKPVTSSNIYETTIIGSYSGLAPDVRSTHHQIHRNRPKSLILQPIKPVIVTSSAKDEKSIEQNKEIRLNGEDNSSAQVSMSNSSSTCISTSPSKSDESHPHHLPDSILICKNTNYPKDSKEDISTPLVMVTSNNRPLKLYRMASWGGNDTVNSRRPTVNLNPINDKSSNHCIQSKQSIVQPDNHLIPKLAISKHQTNKSDEDSEAKCVSQIVIDGESTKVSLLNTIVFNEHDKREMPIQTTILNKSNGHSAASTGNVTGASSTLSSEFIKKKDEKLPYSIENDTKKRDKLIECNNTKSGQTLCVKHSSSSFPLSSLTSSCSSSSPSSSPPLKATKPNTVTDQTQISGLSDKNRSLLSFPNFHPVSESIVTRPPQVPASIPPPPPPPPPPLPKFYFSGDGNNVTQNKTCSSIIVSLKRAAFSNGKKWTPINGVSKQKSETSAINNSNNNIVHNGVPKSKLSPSSSSPSPSSSTSSFSSKFGLPNKGSDKGGSKKDFYEELLSEIRNCGGKGALRKVTVNR